MKKVVKIISIILISFIIFSISPVNNTYASGIGEIVSGADDFISDGASGSSPIKDQDMRDISDPLFNALLIIAIVIAVVIGLVIGLKFMTGSVAEKAKIKETLMPYIAGCIVIFGAFAIWKLVVEIMKAI